MISKKQKFLSLLLIVLMLVTCFVISGIPASAVTSSAGDVVYFDNSITKYSTVYAYMWKDGVGSNAGWPGEPMTNVSGDIWGYNIKGAYDKIIFTQGTSSYQSTDLTYNGNGMIAVPNDTGRFNVTWSKYTGEETLPTTATESTSATQPSSSTESTQPSSGDGEDSYIVFCQNDAGWADAYVYMWNDNSGENKKWPGVQMTYLGDGFYMHEFSTSYANIIFNSGTGTQTGNMKWQGNSYCYNNSTKAWSQFDLGAVRISSFTTSLKSPVYTSCSVKIQAEATSEEGEVSYKFTVSDAYGTTVLSDGSASSTVWVPSVGGVYTLKVEVTDTAGNTSSRETDFTVVDSALLEAPYIGDFMNTMGTVSEIQLGSPITFMTYAIGGNIGTNLLFYKYEITCPDATKNIAYYTLSNTYSFVPKQIGTYKIKVSVQNSYNETVTNTYTYTAVEEINESSQPTDGVIVGDVDGSGEMDVNDATHIQKFLSKLIDTINAKTADVNGDGVVSIRDATVIQLKLAKIMD